MATAFYVAKRLYELVKSVKFADYIRAYLIAGKQCRKAVQKGSAERPYRKSVQTAG